MFNKLRCLLHLTGGVLCSWSLRLAMFHLIIGNICEPETGNRLKFLNLSGKAKATLML